MRRFYEVRWSKVWILWLFANSPFEKGSRSSDSVSEQQEDKSNAGAGANGLGAGARGVRAPNISKILKS